MKYTFQLLCSFLFAITQYGSVNAQGTENFETAIAGATSFTNNGKTFNLTTDAPDFFVANISGLGYNASNRFIHLNDSYGSVSSISVPLGSFKINSFWFYITGNATQFPGAPNPNTGPGSVIFRGKLNGDEQFSFTKSTGFATNFTLPGNGFELIDFATEGGANNTNTLIDQLEIELSSNFDYFAIDNFNWAQGALPVTFGSVNATVSHDNCQVSWQTLSETNNDHFEVQLSTDGEKFTTVSSVKSKAQNGSSAEPISYEIGFNFNAGTVLAGFSLMSLFFLSVANTKRKRILAAFAVFLVAATWAGCSKNGNEVPGVSDKYYLRIAQVDKDGTKIFSKVVTVTETK